jgi:hypothetical protein
MRDPITKSSLGSLVHKSQMLFENRSRPFKAAADRAKGDLAQGQIRAGHAKVTVAKKIGIRESDHYCS